MATAIAHKCCISGKHYNEKRSQQPDHEIGALRMPTVTAKWAIFAHLFAACFAVFKK